MHMGFSLECCFLNRDLALFSKKFQDTDYALTVSLLLTEVLRASKREMSVATRGTSLYFVSFRHIVC
jgi:hypothetical protein